MPLSKYDSIPVVMDIVDEEKPRTVLDIGIGMGLWGAILRGNLDWADERYIKDEYQEQWRTIDGIEIFEGYHNPIWDYCYDTIKIGNVVDLITEVPQSEYTLILMADILEHLNDEDKKFVISEACKKTGLYTIVVSPTEFHQNNAFLEINPHEKHLSVVGPEDFPDGTKQIIAREQNIFIYRKF